MKSKLIMKPVLAAWVLAAVLTGCSGGDDNKQAAAKPQNAASSGSSAPELEPKNIANYDEKLDVEKMGMALGKVGASS